MEVVVEGDEVVAYVLASRNRQLASRFWNLVPTEGIVVTCHCAKGPGCERDGIVLLPAGADGIEKQILDEITLFRREYGLPSKKLAFSRFSGPDTLAPLPRFRLAGVITR